MKLQLIFEGDSARFVAVAEGDWEKRMLGALGQNVDAEIRFASDSHVTHGKVDHATIVLTRRA